MQLGDRIPVGNTALGRLLLPPDIGKRGTVDSCRDGDPPESASAAEARSQQVSDGASGAASCEGGSFGAPHPPSGPCSARGEEPQPVATPCPLLNQCDSHHCSQLC